MYVYVQQKVQVPVTIPNDRKKLKSSKTAARDYNSGAENKMEGNNESSSDRDREMEGAYAYEDTAAGTGNMSLHRMH
jgi:hypothetical protein